MSQIEKESLSALLDNEADSLELRRVLKACEKDPSLLETWERYNLVQSVLHESAVPVGSTLSNRIADQLATESPLTIATTTFSWKQGLTKMAIAASVAAVFLFTLQITLDNGPNSTAIPALADQLPESPNQVDHGVEPAPFFLAEAEDSALVPIDGGRLTEYIESLTLDEEEPVRIEHIQDSPLYRLVNELQAKP